MLMATSWSRRLFMLACGAVESARLLLLSRSGRFPNGLANGNDQVGRNATFHEYSAAIGAFDDPVYGWAGGGYVGASTFEFMEHGEEPVHHRFDPD
jgi:choline dehydrogenase-like flavoprotein